MNRNTTRDLVAAGLLVVALGAGAGATLGSTGSSAADHAGHGRAPSMSGGNDGDARGRPGGPGDVEHSDDWSPSDSSKGEPGARPGRRQSDLPQGTAQEDEAFVGSGTDIGAMIIDGSTLPLSTA